MLDGTEIGTITIGDEFGGEGSPDTPVDEPADLPGFDLVSVAFALLVVALIARVRNR